MAGKIIIDKERCKGCGLCMRSCPKGCITMSQTSNSSGYYPAKENNMVCIGCCMCALMCPEGAIEVMRDKPAASKKTGTEVAKKVTVKK